MSSEKQTPQDEAQGLEGARFTFEPQPGGAVDVVVLAKPQEAGAKPVRAVLARCRNQRIAFVLLEALRAEAGRQVEVATRLPDDPRA